MPTGVNSLSSALRSPAFAATLLCCCITAAFSVLIMRQTGGMFVYPLDDSYIHLAEAHTLAVDHIWGVRPDMGCAAGRVRECLLLADMDHPVGGH